MAFAKLPDEVPGTAATRRRRRPLNSALAGTALVAAAFGLASAAAPAAEASVSAEASIAQASAVAASAATSAAAHSAATSSTSVAAMAAAASAAHHGTPSVPPVVRVKPGVLAIGGGYSLTLTHDSVTLSDADGGQVGPKYTDDGNQEQGSVSMQIDGKAVAGLFLGSGAASATVTVGGTVYQATVVTLRGNPGWSEIYVVLPAAPDMHSPITNSVYDRDGHLLATLTNPGFPA